MPRKKTTPAEESEELQSKQIPEGIDSLESGQAMTSEAPEQAAEDAGAPLEQDAGLDAPQAEGIKPPPDARSDIASPPYGSAPPGPDESGAIRPKESEGLSIDLSAPGDTPALSWDDADVPPVKDGTDDTPLDGVLHREEAEEPVVLPDELIPEEKETEKSERQKFFALNFNRLDRDLSPEQRREWNSIYASYRSRSALTGPIAGVDPFHVGVWNRTTMQREQHSMLCASVVPYRVRIVIPESEMWEPGTERPDYVFRNMDGAIIDFIIIQVARESGFAVASRRQALRARRYYFARRPALHTPGARVKCRVLSVGARQCLVECYGHDLNLTQREMSYTAIPNLQDVYHRGEELDCIVKYYDPDTDKLEISVKETEPNPYDGAELRHPVGSRRRGVIAGKYGGGVFCNLTDGTVCMCNYSYQHEDSDFMVGDNVTLVIQRFDDRKKQIYGKILSKW